MVLPGTAAGPEDAKVFCAHYYVKPGGKETALARLPLCMLGTSVLLGTAGPEDAKIFCAHYYVKPGGNCDLSGRSDPHGEFTDLNVLIARQVGGPMWGGLAGGQVLSTGRPWWLSATAN